MFAAPGAPRRLCGPGRGGGGRRVNFNLNLMWLGKRAEINSYTSLGTRTAKMRMSECRRRWRHGQRGSVTACPEVAKKMFS